jgi:uncharacterized protein YkwD
MFTKLNITPVAILLLIVLINFQVVLAQQASEEKAIAERTLLLINNYRQSKGLIALEQLPVIYEECLNHSLNMAKTEDMGHDGFDERIKNIRKNVMFVNCAENVAYNFGQNDPAMSAFSSWRNSRGHHQNMLGKFTHTGLAVVKHKGYYYFTQIFIQKTKK